MNIRTLFPLAFVIACQGAEPVPAAAPTTASATTASATPAGPSATSANAAASAGTAASASASPSDATPSSTTSLAGGGLGGLGALGGGGRLGNLGAGDDDSSLRLSYDSATVTFTHRVAASASDTAALNRYRPGVLSCYKVGLTEKLSSGYRFEPVEGSAVVRIAIAPNGDPKAMTVSTSSGLSPILAQRCIVSRVAAMGFDAGVARIMEVDVHFTPAPTP